MPARAGGDVTTWPQNSLVALDCDARIVRARSGFHRTRIDIRLHREHSAGEGACVRATWVKVDAAQIDRGIEFYKMTILPALEELDGFCSASLLVDRASGLGVAAATFDNAEAIERNKEALDRIKATGSQEANAEVLDQCDFELAVAHLRLPEMV